MAVVNSIKKSELEKAKRRNAKKFKEQIKKFQEQPSERFDAEIEKKDNILDLYQNLSPKEKAAFDKELEKKKIRDNYARYLKYVFPEYIITPFHALLCNIVQSVVEKVENGEKVRLCLSCPPQHGKGYPTDTPILTTNGWKKHGDLVVGDYIYNDKGNKVKVIGTQTPYMHKCLKVNFANGESHIVTREHLWKVYLEKEHRIDGKHHNIREEKIIETKDLMELLPKCRRSPYVLMNEPIKNDNKKLIIDPYVFGLWLGDGTSSNNDICVCEKDLAEELSAIGDKEPYIVANVKDNICAIKLGNTIKKVGRCGFSNDFRERLNKLGVLRNKHIPTDYLLSSIEQRFELLRGLMDTDGCCDTRGNCEFTNVNKELAYNVYTLLHSLGIKARINEYNATLKGRFISKKYRVLFNPDKDNLIFHISRKQNRLSNKQKNDREDKYKYFIKSIDEVDDQLVSCISVEGGMYLAGKELIPTHNSKTLTESAPSWFLGRNPDLRAILTAYNADIAEKFGDRNRQLIKEHGKDIFDIEVSESQDNKTLWDLNKHRGGLYSAGILGGITSNTSQFTIVDDPYKNGLEAENPEIREKVWQTFVDSIMTRSQGKGNAIIVIHTRWHEDDLIGRLIKLGWANINIPCVWEEGVDRHLGRKIGQTLCPELGFDSEWATQMQKALGKRKWNALYQGKPYIDGGNLINRSAIKFYNESTRPQSFDTIEMSCDLTFGGTKATNDNVCIGIWGRVGADHYLLKKVKKKMTFQETLKQLRVLSATFPTCRKKLVEAKANGKATIETLNRDIGGFVEFDPGSKSKKERFENVIPYFESGNVWFPDETLDPTIDDDVDEILRFPNYTHDDFVDMVSQYLLNYEYRYGGKIQTDSYFSQISDVMRGIKI